METDHSSAEITERDISSIDLATKLEGLEILSRQQDDEKFLSLATGSLVSSTSNEAPADKKASSIPRKKLNEYSVSKNITPITQPWME